MLFLNNYQKILFNWSSNDNFNLVLFEVNETIDMI